MSDTNKQIADRIREVRENCDMTPENAAKNMGMSVKTYLSYEEGKKDIPISVLYEMARVFGVDMTELLTGSAPKLRSYCLVRNGEGVEIERYEGYRFQSLAFNFLHKKIEPLLVTVEPEDIKNMSLVTHPGQEFNYVLEGSIKIILGDTEIEMHKGDSIYFDPEIPHGQAALNCTAKFLTVILHK